MRKAENDSRNLGRKKKIENEKIWGSMRKELKRVEPGEGKKDETLLKVCNPLFWL